MELEQELQWVRVRSVSQVAIGEVIKHDVFGIGTVTNKQLVSCTKDNSQGQRLLAIFEGDEFAKYVDPNSKHVYHKRLNPYVTDEEFPAVLRRPVDVNDEPWREYVRAHCRIEATTSHEFLLSFIDRYAEATGHLINEGDPGLHVFNFQPGNKWATTLGIHFPTHEIPEDLPVKPKKLRGNGFVIYSNKLAWELLDNGMVLG